MKVKIYRQEDFIGMRKAGKLAAETLDYIKPYIVPDVSTDYLNQLCHEFIISNNAIPAPLNYNGFPKSICTSINHVVCHGIPSEKKLKDGDIINIDVTVLLDGWYGDTSRMFFVGKASIKAKKLVRITYEALMKAINLVKPGITLGDIGYVIQTHAEANYYSVVRDYTGHGIGRVFHDSPVVLHYGNPGEGLVLKENMFFTIEPMINAGAKETLLSKDGWTVFSRDKSLSAQFEHSVAVTADGCEIFTLSPQNIFYSS